MECSFVVDRKGLLAALTQFKKIEKSAKKKLSVLEVTVIDGALILIIPGIELKVKAETHGSVKFSVKLWYITDIVSTAAVQVLNCLITENALKIGNSIFNVYTTFFKDDSVLRSIDLPANYDYIDIYKLQLTGKYTQDEIEFNNLSDKIVDASKQIKSDVDRVAVILRKYGFTKRDISDMMVEKLKNNS